jgi:hypothetical protein
VYLADSDFNHSKAAFLWPWPSIKIMTLGSGLYTHFVKRKEMCDQQSRKLVVDEALFELVHQLGG